MRAEPTPVHKYLRAWRKHVGLSQEQLGNILGVDHTTVGRWERGTVPLTSEQLERLAHAFMATPAQLLVDPMEASAVEKLQEVYDIMQAMDEATLAQWLDLGRKLSK